MIHAVFFDLDDTLCDSAPAFAAGREAAFAEAVLSIPGLTEARLRAAWEQAHTDLVPLLESGALTMAQVRDTRFRRTLANVGTSDDALADRLNDLLGATQLARLRRFDDVAALGALRERGVFMGVITNGAGDTATDSQRTKLNALRLLSEVDGFWISDDMGYRKPDPRAFTRALAAAGAEPGDCLYIGDSPATDIAGANAAGMRSALLRRDATAHSTPADGLRPWRIIGSLWELFDLLNTD